MLQDRNWTDAVIRLDYSTLALQAASLRFFIQRTPAPETSGAVVRCDGSNYFVAEAFFAGVDLTGFGFQKSRSSLVQIFGNRLMVGVKT